MASVPAGPWHLIGDGIILESVDVHFEIVLRRGGVDSAVVAWDQHFEPLPGNSFKAQALDLDSPGVAIDFEDGDAIVFRYSGQSATNDNAYIPNGEAGTADGRNPAILLPP
ncbi:MAG: hypothetical protein ABI867_31050 [Kofleriaceae bacterium]